MILNYWEFWITGVWIIEVLLYIDISYIFAAKIWVAFAMQKLLKFFFSAKISMYLPFFRIEILTSS